MKATIHLHNPHLPGNAFNLAAGTTGILLIHGFTATTAEVRPLAEFLHKLGYTISAPLLPGHFSQPKELNQVKWQDWAAEVEQAYQALSQNCSQIIVGGESTGALLSLLLAIKHPDIKALLLYAPALRLNLSSINKIKLYLFAPFIPYIPKPNLDDNPYWQGYPVNPLKGTLQLLRLQSYLRPRLDQVNQPMLVVQGRRDATVHPETPDYLDQHVASEIKEIHWMDRSAHCVIIDQEMDQVNLITINFLTKILNSAHKQEAA